MKLDKEQIKHIASLARLGLSDEDIDMFSVQLSEVLDNFDILNQIDTTNVQPAAQIISIQNVFRDDRVEKSLPQSEVLHNAPMKKNSCFKVQSILP